MWREKTVRDVYIDARLDSLDVAAKPSPRDWFVMLGRPWLLLTPGRLSRLAARLGLADARVERLVADVRRYSGDPGAFCRPLGLDAEPHCERADYPPALCPECDGVHQPHPLDAHQPCPECREREYRRILRGPTPFEERERREDAAARRVMMDREPSLFEDGELVLPNWRMNRHQRLERDWDAAVNRVLVGETYREIARDMGCSVGLLHKNVKEKRNWENN